MSHSLPDRLEEVFWHRHSNPRSGWSRVPTGPLLVYAVYRRNWRLLLAGLAWAVLNPVLFSPPETEHAWMTRAVLAERWWVRSEGRRTVGFNYPNVCNTGGALAFVYALYAASRQRPAGTALGTLGAVALKLWWLRVLVQRYEKRPTADTGDRHPDTPRSK